jgi:hypothetical protein
LRFSTIERKPTEILDLTSLTLNEFQILVAPFEAAFQDYMREWRLDGKLRTARSYTTCSNCPLPQPEDRLLFILVYLKTNPLQVAHGRMFGMPQNKPINGFMSCCQSCATACERLVIRPLAHMPAWHGAWTVPFIRQLLTEMRLTELYLTIDESSDGDDFNIFGIGLATDG